MLSDFSASKVQSFLSFSHVRPLAFGDPAAVPVRIRIAMILVVPIQCHSAASD
jgi:hypothetical protein